MYDNASVSNNTVSESYIGDGGGVWSSGTFYMFDNASVSGNTASGIGGGGVYSSGNFYMFDNASVTGNAAKSGGGVYIRGNFTMSNNASVTNNSSSESISTGGGGGVYVENGTFTMKDSASVKDNITRGGGGGVMVNTRYSMQNATFTMQSGTISGNTAGSSGGGVYFGGSDDGYWSSAVFTMQDGTISGNTANEQGGGVYGNVTKTGGTIYGNDADQELRNILTGRERRGYAISNGSQWRNATAGPTMNPETYGFWLNEDVEYAFAFPSGFLGTWKRDNFNNTLTLTANTLKASNQYYTWNLMNVSGDSYSITVNSNTPTITIRLVDGNLVISGDSGTGQDNWNGTWRKQ